MTHREHAHQSQRTSSFPHPSTILREDVRQRRELIASILASAMLEVALHKKSTSDDPDEP